MIITYRHRPKPKRKTTQPAKVTGPTIISARKPKKYKKKAAELADDPKADERVRQFFLAMGLTLPPEQQ